MQNSNQFDYQKLFEKLPTPYLILSTEFKILAVNDRYLEMTNTERAEILNQSVFDVFPDNPQDPHVTGSSNLRASLNRVLKFKKSDTMAIQKYDIPIPKTQGVGWEVRYWSPMNAPVLKGDEVEYIIHLAEDVTEFVRIKEQGRVTHRIAEELREKADVSERVRQSQRLEAMGQLAGGVAHDFNNLLNVILLNCEIGIKSQDVPTQFKRIFEQIHETSHRATSLTRQLLAFSSKQVLQPKIININAVLSEMQEFLSRVITEDVDIEFNLKADLGNTLLDRGQLEQILLNLLVNARDAMPRGGKITIETANVVLEQGLAKGSIKVDPGEYVMLSITDTGVGMNAEVQARLFEPFFTTKVVGKGTGLGLATVYGIVSQNKGTIWVYSEPQKGSQFKVYFPLIKSDVEPAVERHPVQVEKGSGQHILLVEDEDQLRELTAELLTFHGYRVTPAINGRDALDKMKSIKDIEIIITDVVMPELTGKDLVAKIHGTNSKVKVLFMSGYTSDTLSQYGINGEQPHFLEKPFSLNALLGKVKQVLNS